MLVTIVLIATIMFFVAKYKEQRRNGISFDDVDIFNTREKEYPVKAEIIKED